MSEGVTPLAEFDEPGNFMAAPAPVAAAETPSFLEMVIFFVLAGILLLVTQVAGAVLVMHLHGASPISLRQLAANPRFSIPIMAISYAVILAACVALYGRIWTQGFFRGIHWNWQVTRRHLAWLPLLGILLGVGIQFASSFLPIPKQMPIDAMFRTPFDAWMVALFGVFIAPCAEEIAFRGFLYPALRPWTGRLLAAVLTSVPFALLLAQQVAHAWTPLAMVFLVSLVLVAVRERTGSVSASAIVHACYNLSIFAALFAASDGFRHLQHLND
jgi:membrane protease YdiL (CAAX protease family)